MDQEQKMMDATSFWNDPEATGAPVDVFSFLAMFVRRWPFLLLLAILSCALAIGLSFFIKPQFTSRAVFLPPTLPSNADNTLALILRPPSSSIYLGLLTSDSVLTDVVEHTDLQKVYGSKDIDMARQSLRAAVTVTTDASGFVSLQVTDKDPKLAQTIATNLLGALSRLNDRLAVSEAAQRRLIFQSELEHAKNDLEASEVALKQAQEKSGVVSPEAQISSGLSAIEVSRAQIRGMQVALSALLQGQTEQSPEVRRARSEIATEEAQLARLQSSSGGPQGAGLSAAQAPSVALKFVQLEREVKYNQVLFDVMAKQYENAKLQESSAAPGVQVVDLPQLPLHRSKPSRNLFAVVGLLAGFLLGLMIVFIRNRLQVLREDPVRARSLEMLTTAISAGHLHP